MLEHLDLIVCGATEQTEHPAGDSRIHDIEPSLSEVSADVWNRHLENARADFLAIADKTRPVSNEEFQTCLDLLASKPALDGILLFSPVYAESVSAWKSLPTQVAVLRENPVERVSAVVFRTSALKELGFQAVSEPVWDLLIRAAAKPASIEAVALSGDWPETGKLTQPTLPELAPREPGSERSWLRAHLDDFYLEKSPVADNVRLLMDAAALKAGLFQIHDYLDASHALSQSIEGKGRHRSGDYWHAIMHRREPDYSNAKYWFRNVGSHPIFERLGKAVDSLLAESDNPGAETARQKLRAGGKWDPFAFVDFCQDCERKGDPELTGIAKQIQWREMQLLLEQTYQDATG